MIFNEISYFALFLVPSIVFFHGSENIAEAWRRWHISLSSWIRDYLYIPLGGSRRGDARTAINLLIAFTLSGLWHGRPTTSRLGAVAWSSPRGMSVLARAFSSLATKFIYVDF
jgi:hypothetical protein